MCRLIKRKTISVGKLGEYKDISIGNIIIDHNDIKYTITAIEEDFIEVKMVDGAIEKYIYCLKDYRLYDTENTKRILYVCVKDRSTSTEENGCKSPIKCEDLLECIDCEYYGSVYGPDEKVNNFTEITKEQAMEKVMELYNKNKGSK